MKIISIEGNIGSGKSTFLKYLKDHLTSDKICFLDEPVDDWLSIVDTNDKNIIERYYDDQKNMRFRFKRWHIFQDYHYKKKHCKIIHTIRLLWNEAYLQIEMSFVKCYTMII